MSQITNSQRELTLREWITKNVKNKSKECIMFCDPTKRKVTHEVFGRHEAEVKVVEEDIVVPVRDTKPHRK